MDANESRPVDLLHILSQYLDKALDVMIMCWETLNNENLILAYLLT